jgi:hypothetical protein
MTQVIEITIAPDGQTKLETKGFTGASCRDASRFIEQALGQQVGEQLTAEFHEAQPTQQMARGEN